MLLPKQYKRKFQKATQFVAKDRLLLLVIVCYALSIFYVSSGTPEKSTAAQSPEALEVEEAPNVFPLSGIVKPSKFYPHPNDKSSGGSKDLPMDFLSVRKRMPSSKIQLSGGKADEEGQKFIKQVQLGLFCKTNSR